MTEDFIKQPLQEHDTVVYMPSGTRQLSYGEIIHLMPKLLEIRDIESGKVSSQKHSQVIKIISDQLPNLETSDTITISRSGYETLIDAFSILSYLQNNSVIKSNHIQQAAHDLFLNREETWLNGHELS